MFVTFKILKLERSRDGKAVHFSNMDSMFVTLAVSKLETLSEVKDEHP